MSKLVYDSANFLVDPENTHPVQLDERSRFKAFIMASLNLATPAQLTRLAHAEPQIAKEWFIRSQHQHGELIGEDKDYGAWINRQICYLPHHVSIATHIHNRRALSVDTLLPDVEYGFINRIKGSLIYCYFWDRQRIEIRNPSAAEACSAGTLYCVNSVPQDRIAHFNRMRKGE